MSHSSQIRFLDLSVRPQHYLAILVCMLTLIQPARAQQALSSRVLAEINRNQLMMPTDETGQRLLGLLHRAGRELEQTDSRDETAVATALHNYESARKRYVNHLRTLGSSNVEYQLVVDKEGYHSRTIPFMVHYAYPKDFSGGLSTPLIDGTVGEMKLSGTVATPTGETLGGASIRLEKSIDGAWSPVTSWNSTTITDPSGSFELKSWTPATVRFQTGQTDEPEAYERTFNCELSPVTGAARRFSYRATFRVIPDAADLRRGRQEVKHQLPNQGLGYERISTGLKFSVECVLIPVGNGADEAPLSGLDVVFTIDKPATIGGGRQTVSTAAQRRPGTSTAIAQTTGVYSRDGDEIITVFAHYPKTIEVAGSSITTIDTASQIRILHPICSDEIEEGTGRQVFSDVLMSDTELEADFRRALEAYGGPLSDSANDDNPIDVYYYLCNVTAPLPWSLLDRMRTDFDMKLRTKVIELHNSAQKTVSPGELFGMALKMSGGDVYTATKACHNMLEGTARRYEPAWEEVYRQWPRRLERLKQQITAKAKTPGYTNDPDYQRLKTEFNKLSIKINSFTGGKSSVQTKQEKAVSRKLFAALTPLRTQDNRGAWYHLFGTMMASMNSTAREGDTRTDSVAWEEWYINGPDKMYDEIYKITAGAGMLRVPLSAETFAKVVCYFEERYVSGDFFTDPSEYCIDLSGSRMGSLVYRKLHPTPSPPPPKIVFPPTPQHVIVHKCPVNISITSGAQRFFFDQRSGAFGGDLALGFFPFPDPSGTWSALYTLPDGETEVSFEVIDNGPLEIARYDTSTRTSTVFRFPSIAPGERVTLISAPGQADPVVRDSRGILRRADDRAVLSSSDVDSIKKAGALEDILDSQTVDPDNSPPLADFEIIPPKALVGRQVIIMSACSDPDGDDLVHTWYVNGHNTGIENQLNWEFLEPPLGFHTIRLVVEDGRGGRAELEKQLYVGESWDDPNMEAELEPYSEEELDEPQDGRRGDARPDPIEIGAETSDSSQDPTCDERYSSLDEAYEDYIEAYTDLTSAVLTIDISSPSQLRAAQTRVRELQRQRDAGDRRAYQEHVAALNQLNSLVTTEEIVSPSELATIQRHFFRAKSCYEDMLATR